MNIHYRIFLIKGIISIKSNFKISFYICVNYFKFYLHMESLIEIYVLHQSALIIIILIINNYHYLLQSNSTTQASANSLKSSLQAGKCLWKVLSVVIIITKVQNFNKTMKFVKNSRRSTQLFTMLSRIRYLVQGRLLRK